MAYVEVGQHGIFKDTLISQLNGNPTLSKDRSTRINVGVLYMKPKLLTITNHDTGSLLNFDRNCGVCFFNTYEARIVKKHGSPKRKLQLRFGLLGGFIRCLGNLVIIGWSIGIQLT